MEATECNADLVIQSEGFVVEPARGMIAMAASTVVAPERIGERIILVRGEKVLLDSDLAALYAVTTKRLNEQVRRNRPRFPSDFVFALTDQEVAALRSQNATSNRRRGRWQRMSSDPGARSKCLCSLCAPSSGFATR
jgi:hypothetical protein